MRGMISCAAVAIVALCGACTPTLQYLRVASTFDYPTLKSGGLAVLPVATDQSTISDTDLSAMRNQLLARIANSDIGVPVLGITETDAVLASDTTIGADWVATHALAPERVMALGQKLSARYLVLCRMDSYKTEKGTSWRTEETKNKEGKVISTKEFTVFYHRGDLHGAMTIFDAHDGSAVWEGVHSSTHSNVREEKDDELSKNTVVALMQIAADVMTSPREPTYPSAPRATDLSPYLMYAFVANWPQADSD
jgi:hypothetical protein